MMCVYVCVCSHLNRGRLEGLVEMCVYVCVCSHLNRGRLEGLVAEHLDHLYYIKDILSLGLVSLNTVLIDQLLNRLLIPLYVFSLTDHNPFPEGVSTHITCCASDSLLLLTARGSSYQHHCSSLPAGSSKTLPS